MRIAFIFASRSRPDKFYRCLDNIRAMAKSDNYFVWAKLDVDDPTLDKYQERLKEYPEVNIRYGVSQSKIHAINRNLEDLPECDILVNTSDDIIYDVPGFDNDIREAFQKCFPNLDGTINFPDDHGKSNTIIVSMLGINLFKFLGYIYNPEFISVYADNHFTEMTKKMGKYAFINKRLFTHAHPMWNLSEWDSQYRKTESKEFYQKDKETFLRLRAENFGL
jgi:hypothetical protein